jgi:hypothetical protein
MEPLPPLNAAWLVLIGAPSPTLLDHLQRSDQPILWVTVDPPEFQGYASWGDCCCANRAHTSVVLGDRSDTVCWYRYNDPRRNGLRGPEEMVLLHPNLKLEALELRLQCPLADLLDTWPPSLGDGGMLVLAGWSDWPTLLAGAGASLERCSSVWVECPPSRLEDSWQILDDLLHPAWLKRQEGCSWQRDVLLQQASELQRLQAELQKQHRLSNALMQERDALRRQLDQIDAELDLLLVSVSESNTSVDSTTG